MSVFSSTDPKRLGHELQLARKARGYTQEAAAKLLAMARTTLVAIEKGDRRLTEAEFEQACQLYGRSPADFLHSPPSRPSFQVQFRGASPQLGDDEDQQDKNAAIEKLETFAQSYLALENLTGSPMPRRFPPALSLADVGAYLEQAAEDLASQERNRIGLGDGPVLNLRERLESDVGVRVFYFPMTKRLAGLYGFSDELGACIGINSLHPVERGRWSLAHEYGHFLTTRFTADVDLVSDSKVRSQSERFVDHFARAFLMPSAGLHRRVSDSQRGTGGFTLAGVCALANLYAVSIQAMMLRLEELGRVKAGTWESIRRRGFRPESVKKELNIPAWERENRFPTRFRALAILALERGLLTTNKLGELIGEVDPAAIKTFVDDYRAAMNVELDGKIVLFDALNLSDEVGR